jgi:hypothetical protein
VNSDAQGKPANAASPPLLPMPAHNAETPPHDASPYAPSIASDVSTPRIAGQSSGHEQGDDCQLPSDIGASHQMAVQQKHFPNRMASDQSPPGWQETAVMKHFPDRTPPDRLLPDWQDPSVMCAMKQSCNAAALFPVEQPFNPKGGGSLFGAEPASLTTGHSKSWPDWQEDRATFAPVHVPPFGGIRRVSLYRH